MKRFLIPSVSLSLLLASCAGPISNGSTLPPTPEPTPLSNQIRIFPFDDRNGDGVRQADEEILTGTRYMVSGPGGSAQCYTQSASLQDVLTDLCYFPVETLPNGTYTVNLQPVLLSLPNFARPGDVQINQKRTAENPYQINLKFIANTPTRYDIYLPYAFNTALPSKVGQIRGTVKLKSPLDNSPFLAPNLKIRFLSKSTREVYTDAQGRFALGSLPVGLGALEVWSGNRRLLEQIVTVTSGQWIEIALEGNLVIDERALDLLACMDGNDDESCDIAEDKIDPTKADSPIFGTVVATQQLAKPQQALANGAGLTGNAHFNFFNAWSLDSLGVQENLSVKVTPPEGVFCKALGTLTSVDQVLRLQQQLPCYPGAEITLVPFEDRDGDGIQGKDDPTMGDLEFKFTHNHGPTFLKGSGQVRLPVGSNYLELVASLDTLGLKSIDRKLALDSRMPLKVSKGINETVSLAYGYPGNVSIFVFEDADGSKSLTAGDSNFANVAVKYTDSEGQSGTVLTDSDGKIVLQGVPPGRLQLTLIRDTLPAQKDRAIVETTGAMERTVLVGSREEKSVLFGYQVVKDGIVEGTVFDDSDGNGRQELGEDGIPGVTIQWTKSGQVAATTQTDSQGRYQFPNLPEGSGTLVITDANVTPKVPSFFEGFTVTTPNASHYHDEFGDRVVVQHYVWPEGIKHIDLGFRAKADSIDLNFYDDLNGNGTRDPGESFFKATQLALFGSTATDIQVPLIGYKGVQYLPGTASTSTNIRNEKLFSPFADSRLNKIVTGTNKPEWVSTANRFTLAEKSGARLYFPMVQIKPGARNGGRIEVGLKHKQVNFTGTVFDDRNQNGIHDNGELLLPGAQVQTESGVVAIADAQGKYTMNVVDAFNANPILDLNDVYVPAVNVGLSALALETRFGVPVKKEEIFILYHKNDMGETTEKVDFPITIPRINARGQLFEDQNGNGVMEKYGPKQEIGMPQGVVLTLKDAFGQIHTTSTKIGGVFDFPGVPVGPATVEIDASTLVSPMVSTTGTMPMALRVEASATGTYLLPDIGLMKRTTNGSITGVVFEDANGNSRQDPGEMPLLNVVLSKTSPSPTLQSMTNASGQFSFTDVPEGNTRIEITVPAGYAETTPKAVVVPVQPGQTSAGWAFGLRQMIGSVSVNVFDDVDANGTRDSATEMGLVGVAMELTDAKGTIHTAMTDATGKYNFTKIPEGMASLTLKQFGYVNVTTAVQIEGGQIRDVVVGMHD
ncbi:MAG: SdrD B-like domain-containing protein [Deinococcaceae bacterium]